MSSLSRRQLLARAALAPAVVGLGVGAASCASTRSSSPTDPFRGAGLSVEADMAPDPEAYGPRIACIDTGRPIILLCLP